MTISARIVAANITEPVLGTLGVEVTRAKPADPPLPRKRVDGEQDEIED
jgi:hypothetical protein